VSDPQIPEEEPTAEYASKLTEGRQRFLAHVVEHGLFAGRRTPDDFIRHFPPAVLMESLADRAQLRARILEPATGLKPRIAEKKSPESAGEDLQLALDEGETDAETIVSLLDPDDRIRFLDHRTLWEYVAEGDFWKATEGIDFEIARAHVDYILEQGLAEALITPRDVVEHLGIEKLAELLPRAELSDLISAALDRGRDKKPFRDEDLLDVVPIGTLTEHVPLALIWESVIVPRIAEVHGFSDRSVAPSKGSAEDSGSEELPRPDPPEAFDFSDENTANGDLHSDVINAAAHERD